MRHLSFHAPPRVLPNLDWMIIGLAVMLSLAGIMTIWGASATDGEIGALTGYSRRQLQWTLLGFIALAALALVDYRWSKRAAWFLYAALILTLISLLLFGRQIHGAKSWIFIPLGPGRFQVQPSEIGKVIIVMTLARYLSGRMLTFRKFSSTIIPVLIVILPMALIVAQPDLGTGMIFIPMMFAMFHVAGIRKRVILIHLLIGAGVFALGYPHLKPHQKQRFETFLDPSKDALGSGYSILQAQTALGSGGVFGKGWGRGTQTSFRFLPEYQSDFIFPSLGEQFGLAGCLAALALFALFLTRMTYLAGSTEDLYGALLVTGLTATFAAHVVLNIGMSIGLMPVTGVPLPFFSYGGSFMLTCFIMTGLVVSVRAHRPS